MRRGLLVICSGCAGVGKDTIIEHILKTDSSFRVSLSATTREARDYEKHGVNYLFITEKEFTEMIDRNEFLEYANYVGSFYGTPKKQAEDLLDEGYNVILKIDVQGAAQIKELYPDSVSIFITPPSMEELKNRLINRGTETEEHIIERMKTAKKEMSCKESYDYTVVNDVVECAAEEIISIVKNERAKRSL